MVVIRESPRAKPSPEKQSAQWPPKSPFQALLSSPSGRQKWQDYQSRVDERSPSPSPARRRTTTSGKSADLLGADGEDNGEDEDEEMLRLQLQEIQAKLRLKKLQKLKTSGASENGETHNGANKRPAPRSPSPQAAPRRRREIEVPLSPVRKQRPVQEQLSPARVKLGLTTTLKAQDVSLKRPRDCLQSQPSTSRGGTEASFPKPKSFGERLAEKGLKCDEQEAKRRQLESMRSTGFSRGETHSPTTASSSTGVSRRHPADADTNGLRTPGLNSQPQRSLIEKYEHLLPRSKSSQSLRGESSAQTAKKSLSTSDQENGRIGTKQHGSFDGDSLDLVMDNSENNTGYDPYSQTHLSKRMVRHADVAREMEGKEIYTIPRLLKEVKSPTYEPPDCESDYVVFAILASKSSPFDQATTQKSTDSHGPDPLKAPTNKFMVFHLCDLKWEIDLFLFGTAFNQFWKITPGTLLAILNPAVMPPKGNQHSGRFSLKLGSSEDAVMEIGAARDLGHCISIKKDGKQCEAWVDKRKTEACEFHVSLQIDKARKGRMEVNTMWRGTGPASDDERSRRRRGVNGDSRPKGELKGRTYHREYGTLYSVNTGKSAASMLDAEDMNTLHNMTTEEASRKRIAAAQKDRDLARKLSEMGKGVGAEYLRSTEHFSTTNSTTTSSASRDSMKALFEKPSAADLGLLANKASNARLSPAKDRKRHFGLGALSTRGAEAMGWGGARKAGLLQPHGNKLGSPERGQSRLELARHKHLEPAIKAGTIRPRSQDSNLSTASNSQTPRKKRARFALEKGIREPGRDSLPGGEEMMKMAILDDDDDDDLDIV